MIVVVVAVVVVVVGVVIAVTAVAVLTLFHSHDLSIARGHEIYSYQTVTPPLPNTNKPF